MESLGAKPLPPSFELADGEACLCVVVPADVGWFADGTVAAQQVQLLSESRDSMSVLADEAALWDLLLWPRSFAATREILLLGQEDGRNDDRENWVEMLFAEGRGTRTQHCSVRLWS